MKIENGNVIRTKIKRITGAIHGIFKKPSWLLGNSDKKSGGGNSERLSQRSHNRPKPQCKRKALSTMHYVYTAAVGRPVMRHIYLGRKGNKTPAEKEIRPRGIRNLRN